MEQVCSQVATVLATKNPVEAREILVNPPDVLPAVVEDRMLTHLTLSHAKTTLEWAGEALEGERKANITERVLRSWRVLDPVAAEKWERGSGLSF